MIQVWDSRRRLTKQAKVSKIDKVIQQTMQNSLTESELTP